MHQFTDVEDKLCNIPRRRIIVKHKMGPQSEENKNDVIEMLECVEPVKDDNWNSDEDECEVMLKTVSHPLKDFSNLEEEGFWLIAFQVFFPFLIAGLGMVGAGLVLDIVQASIFFLKFYCNIQMWCSSK